MAILINMGWEKELRDAVCAKDASTVNFILSRKEVRKGIGRDEWKCGEAPLHLAAHFGMNEMVRLFAEVGADVNSYMVGDNGVMVTVLHFAVYGNQINSVQLLLELGADVTLEGKWNELLGTPLDFAHQRGYTEMAQVLQESKDLLEQKHILNTRSLQEMVEKIKSKPEMEKQLEKALDIQRKIKNCDQQHKKVMEEKAKIEDKIQNFKLDPDYRNDRQIQKLVKALAEIQTVATALESNTGGGKVPSTNNKDKNNKNDKNEENNKAKGCPVCFEVPEKVFNCVTCENLICGNCKRKVTSCPSCREDFQAKPPKRNKTAELFL